MSNSKDKVFEGKTIIKMAYKFDGFMEHCKKDKIILWTFQKKCPNICKRKFDQ